jgi:hypothetical protein
MFTFRDPSPYSFDAFLQERHRVEFDQWVIDKQKAALAAAWNEQPPFNLNEMVDRATANVALAIKHSKHNYRLLGNDDLRAKSLGFVTKEGWQSYCNYGSQGVAVLTGAGLVTDTPLPCYLTVLAPGPDGADYVRVAGPDGKGVWQKMQSSTVRIGPFVLVRSSLPKFLLRFTEEIST